MSSVNLILSVVNVLLWIVAGLTLSNRNMQIVDLQRQLAARPWEPGLTDAPLRVAPDGYVYAQCGPDPLALPPLNPHGEPRKIPQTP